MKEGNEVDDYNSFANVVSLRGDTTVTTVSCVVPALSPEEERRASCEKFDSDELADWPEEDIRGTREFEGDAQLDAAMDDFLLEKDGDVFMLGKNKDAKNPRFLCSSWEEFRTDVEIPSLLPCTTFICSTVNDIIFVLMLACIVPFVLRSSCSIVTLVVVELFKCHSSSHRDCILKGCTQGCTYRMYFRVIYKIQP